jgi:type II secretory pathway component GspD/PulD (secretin)
MTVAVAAFANSLFWGIWMPHLLNFSLPKGEENGRCSDYFLSQKEMPLRIPATPVTLFWNDPANPGPAPAHTEAGTSTEKKTIPLPSPAVVEVPSRLVRKPLQTEETRLSQQAKPAKASLPEDTPPPVKTPLCSVDTVEENLSTILSHLSRATGTNLLLLTPTDTKLTIRLVNLPLEDIVRHICAMTGLAYIRLGNTYAIAEAERLAKAYPNEWSALYPKQPEPSPPPQEPILTEVYKVSHVQPAKIVEALKTLFGERPLTILTGPPSAVPSLSRQETSYVTGTTMGAIQQRPPEAGTGRLIVLQGPESEVKSALKVCQMLDQARPQVSIAVMIHDVSNDALRELGLQWQYGDIQITETTPDHLDFGSFTRAPLSFTAKLRALERSEKARLLASPNISVLDGEPAFILIGNRLVFPVLIGFTQANTPIFDKEEERVGIYLQVAAYVTEQREIVLTLYPQVSVVTGFLDINGASYPQISTREAQTTLRVKSGEVIVMGGMFKDEEIKTMEKVPILSQIPILGALFQHRRKTKVSSQVIITILPIILEPDTEKAEPSSNPAP